MIERHRGDMLSVQRGLLVHGCNAQGVMGSGVALAIRRRYPGAFTAYSNQAERLGLHLGDVIFHVVKLGHDGEPSLVVANAVTQQYYGREPDRLYLSYDALSACFQKVAAYARRHGLPVHFPLIGCGLAGGDWAKVAPRIEAELGKLQGNLWELG